MGHSAEPALRLAPAARCGRDHSRAAVSASRNSAPAHRCCWTRVVGRWPSVRWWSIPRASGSCRPRCCTGVARPGAAVSWRGVVRHRRRGAAVLPADQRDNCALGDDGRARPDGGGDPGGPGDPAPVPGRQPGNSTITELAMWSTAPPLTAWPGSMTPPCCSTRWVHHCARRTSGRASKGGNRRSPVEFEPQVPPTSARPSGPGSCQRVMPKAEILDPRGQAIVGALGRQTGVSDVRQGKRFELGVDDSVGDEQLAEIANRSGPPSSRTGASSGNRRASHERAVGVITFEGPSTTSTPPARCAAPVPRR